MNTLTADRLRYLFDYDPDTGVFTRRVTVTHNARAGDVAGSPTSAGYLSIWVDGKAYLAHRLAVLYMTGEWPKSEVDHRDTNRRNNRWNNLRDATGIENATNRRKPRPNTRSGYIGVKASATPGKWRADIKVGGRYRNLGTFTSPEEAHAAYVKAKRQLHPFSTL